MARRCVERRGDKIPLETTQPLEIWRAQYLKVTRFGGPMPIWYREEEEWEEEEELWEEFEEEWEEEEEW